MKRAKYYGLFVAGVLFLCSLIGCTSGNVKSSGFLGGPEMYAKLAPGERALDEVWIAPDADLKKYHQIMLDEVVFYLKEDAENKAIEPEVIKELSEAFHKAFIDKVSPTYRLVAEPGPDVLRVKIAIVDIEPSNRTLDTITTIVPVGAAVSLIKKGVTGAGTGVGSASMEVMFIDSESNKVVALGKDKKVGSKLNMGAKVDEWGHAKAAFAYWAESLKKALDDITAGTFKAK